MLVKVFVLGRPGSGKTTAVLQMLKEAEKSGLRTFRMKDYEILYRMFKQELQELSYSNHYCKKKFRQTDYDGFDVLDHSVFNTALEQLEKNIQAIQRQYNEQNGIITIEFARDNYQDALKRFSSEFLRDAYFFFVETQVEKCIERIYQRVTNPPRPDYHFVSEFIMHTYYSQDNRLYMAERFREEYGITKKVDVYYNTNSLATYLETVHAFTKEIFSTEFDLDIASPVPAMRNSTPV